MLDLHKILPKPHQFWASNYYAAVDTAACEGCGICAKRCQVAAVTVHPNKHPAVVDPDRCLGCGVCVPTCPQEAISLVKKPAEVRPPQTREDLFDIIMAHKKSPLGKLKLTGKLVFDAIATGHTHVLK
jgi:MinD superfamily P-loop ATPase